MTSESFSPFAVRAVIDQMRARIVRRVAELPDRTSPDDWPDAMLVTADELATILSEELADHLLHALAEPQLQEKKGDVTRVEPAGRSERPRTAELKSGNAASAERTER